MVIPVLLAVLLLALATCSTAVAAAAAGTDRRALEERAAQGDRRAAALATTLARPGLERDTRVLVVGSAVGLGLLVGPLVDGLAGRPSPSMSDPARGWSVVLVMMVVLGAQVVVAEMVARSVGAQRPIGTLRVLGRPWRVLTAAVSPLGAALAGVSTRALAALRRDGEEVISRIRSREELRRMVEQSGRSGAIDPEHADLFDRTLRFADKCAADVITPRVEVESLPADATVADLVGRSAQTGFSRFPVRGEDLDEIIGIVHVKDVLGVPAGERHRRPVAELVRPVHAVPESKDLGSLMVELRAAAGQFAVVVDEYGGTAGITTLEDLLEEIVGDISDEHDSARVAPPVRRWAGAHLLSGSLHPDEVHDACEFEVPAGDYETLGGYVMDELGRVPEEGDRFTHDGWVLEVAEMDGHRVRTVKVAAPSPGAQDVVDPDAGGPR